MDIVLPIAALGIPIAVLFALGCGIGLIKRSRKETMPEREQALRWAGGNLIEPAINVFVVAGLMLLFLDPYLDVFDIDRPTWDMFPQMLLVSLPILVLLKPLRGWNSTDEFSRDLNRTLVWLGLLRWAVTVFTLLYPPAVILGLVVLMISLAVILSMADDSVSPLPVRGIAVGMGAEGLKVAPADEFEAGEQARALL